MAYSKLVGTRDKIVLSPVWSAMTPLITIVSALVGYFSYRGGIWLWQNLAASFPHSCKSKIAFGALTLLSVLLVTTIYLFLWILDPERPEDAVHCFTMILALVLAYNSGYLFSIMPLRRQAPVFGGVLRLELSIFFLVSCLCIWSARPCMESVNPVFVLMMSVLCSLVGFLVWEHLRHEELFKDETLFPVLWWLSVGFESICLLAVSMGIAAQYDSRLTLVTGMSIFEVFVSLSFYFVGFIAALSRRQQERRRGA